MMLFLLLVAVPVIIGQYIKKTIRPHDHSFSLFFCALGFLIMLAEFSIFCYPAIYYNTPFHIICNIIFCVYLAESMIIIFFHFKDHSHKNTLKKESIMCWLKSPFFWLMIVMCGYQIIRLIVNSPAEMRDSNSYNALVNDIVQRDQLFRTINATGNPVDTMLDLPIRFTLSAWYPFLAFISKTSHVHALIINNTILPAYILLLSYIILYELGRHVFDDNHSKAFSFTALCALLYEVTLYCHTPTMIRLVWPVWGKGVLSITVVPTIFVLYMSYYDNKKTSPRTSFVIILLLLVIAGCSMSTMGMLVLLIELGVLGIVWSVRKHSPSPFVFSAIAAIPALLYSIVYYYLSTL